jgi:hypothetical protein
MQKAHAAGVVAGACATVMMLGTPAFAVGGFPVRTSAYRTAGRALEPVETGLTGVTTAQAALSCWSDRDHDDRTGHPTDHDGDESARCHAHININVNDGDHDSDDTGTRAGPASPGFRSPALPGERGERPARCPVRHRRT